MTTALAQARTDLYEVLRGVTPSPWRVHRIAPSQIAAPLVYIDSPTIEAPQAGLVSVVLPVVMVVDGTLASQLETLDELLAVYWSASSRVGTPTGSNPVALDVGGPSLRAQVLSVEVMLAAVTMCAPSLNITAGSTR